MKFEIIDYYPINEKNLYRGSLKIKFPDLGIEILGIRFVKRDHGWVVKLPYISSLNKKEKRVIRFPLFSFLDKKTQRKFFKEIKILGVEFVEKRIEEIKKEMDSYAISSAVRSTRATRLGPSRAKK